MVLSSSKKTSVNTRSSALKKMETPTPGLGTRTIEEPEAQDPLLQAVEEEEGEGEEDGEEGEEEDMDGPLVSKPLESILHDKPFKLFTLSNKAPKEVESEQRKRWLATAREYVEKGIERANVTRFLKDSTPREAGLLKMMVRAPCPSPPAPHLLPHTPYLTHPAPHLLPLTPYLTHPAPRTAI